MAGSIFGNFSRKRPIQEQDIKDSSDSKDR